MPFSSAPDLRGMFIVWDGLFSAQELEAIETLGDGLAKEAAGITGGDNYDGAARVTRIAWMGRAAATDDLYRRMEEVVLAINAQFFRYDLSGISPFQYTLYHQSEGSRFGWHQDYGVDPNTGLEPRKLTLSLQLSRAEDYDGCELQVSLGDKIDSAPMTRGTLVAFPAYMAHRVTPITRGCRKALVIWATGPELR